jgi:putative DNA primase/helicase
MGTLSVSALQGSAVARVLSLIEDAKPSAGAGWIARCPAHDDCTPSLSITEGREGRALLKCHAGCQTEAIAAALGLNLRDLFVSASPSPSRASSGRVIEEYTYTDERGNELFQVCRLEPKSFRQRRRNSQGEWTWGLGSVRRVLYRLPKIKAAIEQEHTVFIVEGEKDVHSLEAHRLPATTNPMGAGKWRTAYNDALRGAQVVILPDNDPPGHAHAECVARALMGIATTVRIVELPGLPVKGDATDWFSAGGTVDTLNELVVNTPVYDPANAHSSCTITQDDVEKDSNKRALVVCLADVQPEKVRWLWPGYLPFGKLTILEGDPGLGKSTLSLAIAAAVSQGHLLPGAASQEPANVVCVTYEDGLADTLRPRLDAAGADTGRVYAISGIKLTGEIGERLASLPDDLPTIFDTVRSLEARLVVIDPLSAALSGETDAYKDTDVRRVLAPMARYAEESGAAVLVIRHFTKSGNRALTAGAGSIGITAAARSVLAIHQDPDHPEDSGARILAVAKCNLVERPPSLQFRLMSEPGAVARIEWAGKSHHTADELAALRADSISGGASVREIDDWLQAFLMDGPKNRRDVFLEGRKAGFSERSLERAAERVNVQRAQAGFGKDKRSEWSILSIPPIMPNPANPPMLARIGGIGGNRTEVLCTEII